MKKQKISEETKEAIFTAIMYASLIALLIGLLAKR